MKKFGIRKTKTNIVLLFLIGVLVGVIIGLRQPVRVVISEGEVSAPVTSSEVKAPIVSNVATPAAPVVEQPTDSKIAPTAGNAEGVTNTPSVVAEQPTDANAAPTVKNSDQ